MNFILKFTAEIWKMFLEMSPYLLLGFIFAGILHVLVSKNFITKQIGKKNIWSTIKATLLGVPLPLCSCGVIPTGISFYKNGASKGATNAFLISTPQTGVDSVLITSSLMNWPWAIFRPFVALLTGILGGVLTNQIDKTETVNEIASCNDCKDKPKRHWIIELFSYAFLEFLPDISRQLVVGILIAVAITIFVPHSTFTSYLTNPFINMLLILVASIPLYVCATGSVPIAASLLALGVSPGAVLVFLMAGPATNAATISVLWKSMGKKSTFAYLFSIVGGALFFGFVMDYFLPKDWFFVTPKISSHIHAESTFGIPAISAIILISLILYVEIKKITPNKVIKMDNSKTYIINGMSCNHCKNSVESNLIKLNTIQEVVVNLENKSVTIKGSAPLEEIKNIVDNLGFSFAGEIKND